MSKLKIAFLIILIVLEVPSFIILVVGYKRAMREARERESKCKTIKRKKGDAKSHECI